MTYFTSNTARVVFLFFLFFFSLVFIFLLIFAQNPDPTTLFFFRLHLIFLCIQGKNSLIASRIREEDPVEEKRRKSYPIASNSR